MTDTEPDESMAMTYLRPLLTERTAEAFINFEMPEAVAQRMQELADKGSAGTLTDAEFRERLLIVQLGDLMLNLALDACEMTGTDPRRLFPKTEPVHG